MKKYRLFLPLVALLMMGCGGSGSSKKPADTTPEPLAVYDFSEFIVPNHNQINDYDVLIYNKEAENNYTMSRDYDYLREYKYEDNNTIIISHDDEEQEKIIFSNNDIIIENLLILDEKISLNKNISVGDVIFAELKDETIEAYIGKRDSTCSITDHLNEMIVDDEDVYSNILEQTCTSNFNASIVLTEDLNSTREDKFIIVKYFAKDIGEISSISEECIIIKVGTEVESNKCIKIETVLHSLR